MRVKVGDTWYEATPDQPIMVELSAADKSNIRRMSKEATKYAIFHEDEKRDRDGRLEWME